MKTKCYQPIEGERSMVNKTHRWSEEFNPDGRTVGQSDRPMVSQEIGR
jgi:hypothetical protein